MPARGCANPLGLRLPRYIYKKMDYHYWSNTEPPKMVMLGFLEEPVIEAIVRPEFEDAPKDRSLAGA